jgi:hypothetical protein
VTEAELRKWTDAYMTYEVLAVAPDVGVARWIASHTN